MKSVFEIIDQTDDEIYYPLGIFTTLDEAKDAIKNIPSDERLSEFNDSDFEKIHIQERKFGWSDNGKTVFMLERHLIFDENNPDDEGHWEIINKNED